MKVSISLTDQSTKFIINNLYPLYLHDLSEIWGFKPNSYGVFEDNETMTLQEQNKVFDIWWEKKTVLYPYLIRVDDIPAGFALVATPPYTPHGNDYYLNEFFILRSYRGTGAAEMAAHQVFDCHRGGWERRVIQMNKPMREPKPFGEERFINIPTESFRRILRKHTMTVES